MPIDPTMLKKISVTILIIIGLFVGYKLLMNQQGGGLSPDETNVGDYELIDSKASSYQDPTDADFAAMADAKGDFSKVPGGDQYGSSIEFFNYYEHTAPGEYSEIFVEITGHQPNKQKIVYVRFAGTQDYIDAGGQDLVTTKDGHISTRFRITSYGDYEVVTYDENGEEVVDLISVK